MSETSLNKVSAWLHFRLHWFQWAAGSQFAAILSIDWQ